MEVSSNSNDLYFSADYLERILELTRIMWNLLCANLAIRRFFHIRA